MMEETLNPKITLAINRQLNELQKKSPDGSNDFLIKTPLFLNFLGVHVIFNEMNVMDLQADIEGPGKFFIFL